MSIEKFMIGTKFYKYEKSCVPVIIRLKKQEGNVLFFNMGGYDIYLTQEEIIDMHRYVELTRDTVKEWYRHINFFGTEVDQKWTMLSENDEDVFVKFKVDNIGVKMTIDELKNNYVRLIPDGFFTISNVTYPIENETKEGFDVMMTVHLLNDKMPSIICRQDCADVFNVSSSAYEIPIGVSIPREACPKNMNYLDFMYSKECKNFKPVAIYLDDSINDIFKYVGSLNRYNATMRKLSEKYKYTRFRGCHTNIYDLATNCGFTEDLKSLFGVFNFPIALDMSRSSMNDREIMLLNKFIKANAKSKFVEATYCPYNKDIDINKLNRKCMLINIGDTKASDVFLLAYKDTE